MELFDIAQKAQTIKTWPDIWKEFMHIFVAINNFTKFSDDKAEAKKQLDDNYNRALELYSEQIDSEILFTDLLKLADEKGISIDYVYETLIARFSELNNESRTPRDFVESMTMLRSNWKKALKELYMLLKDGEIKGLNARTTCKGGEEHA